MLALLLSLGASLTWGVGDFVAGVASRRAGALAVTMVTQVVGASLAAAWVIGSGDPLPGVRDLALAAAAGVAVLLGLGVFYHALAVGTMSIVAPVSATGVILPVVAGLVAGQRPSALQTVGIPLAIGGVALASRERGGSSARAGARRSVALALLAALGGGVFMWLLAPAGRDSVPWAVLVARGSAAPLFAVGVLAVRAPLRPALAARTRGSVLVAGTLGFAAIALYTAASQHGALPVVAVLSSLYPAVTILLARVLLGERLGGVQKLGVVVVLVAVSLIAAG